MSARQLTHAEWYELLFADAEGWVNIFGVLPSGLKESRWAQNATQFAEVLERAGFRDTWFGCATRYENLGSQRGTNDDCREVPGMWVDIDVRGPQHKHEDLPPTIDDAISLLKDFPLLPTIVLHSGGGLQAWWLFDEIQEASDVRELLVNWGATWQQLGAARGWHVDNVFDVARILRVPGTSNHKTDPPVPVEIINLVPDRRYTPDDLSEYTLDVPAVEEYVASSAGSKYDGPERAGDRYNAEKDPGELLEEFGCVLDQTLRNGNRNYRAPHHALEPGTIGITVFPDGKTIVYSETFADEYHFELWADSSQRKRRLYDAFGLLAHLKFDGSFAEASKWLEPREEVDLTGLTAEGFTSATLSPGTTLQVVTQDSIPLNAKFMAGGQFIFDEDAEIEIRWGRGSDVLWAAGESLMLVGPPGVGKTTLAHQVVSGLLGLQREVLGLEVTEAQRVLYLAMDRPKQIRRAMRRLFADDEELRKLLDERLVIQNGPIPYDLGKRPELLLDLAHEAKADVVIIDSLKDAAVKLSDDETGGQVNRAIQSCNAAGVDVGVLHHQRKGQNGERPNKLEDVFGSTWLTAGTGSVVLLWGEAGSELVELVHLKQPMDVVGPWTVEHDHLKGVSFVSRGFDCLAFLRNRGAAGATTDEIARAQWEKEPSASERKKTIRKLAGLCDAKLATKNEPPKVGDPARWFAASELAGLR